LQAGKGGELTNDETTIIAGALELTEKTASQAMTPIKDVFALDVNAKLDLYVIFHGMPQINFSETHADFLSCDTLLIVCPQLLMLHTMSLACSVVGEVFAIYFPGPIIFTGVKLAGSGLH
jgi:hypothetical protein